MNLLGEGKFLGAYVTSDVHAAYAWFFDLIASGETNYCSTSNLQKCYVKTCNFQCTHPPPHTHTIQGCFAVGYVCLHVSTSTKVKLMMGKVRISVIMKEWALSSSSRVFTISFSCRSVSKRRTATPVVAMTTEIRSWRILRCLPLVAGQPPHKSRKTSGKEPRSCRT